MINGIGTETSTSLEPAPTAATDQSAAAAAADFETFLSLLTTQLRNQDPLKPLDSTEFVAQLASFSAVEQQINTNAKLDAITNAPHEANTCRSAIKLRAPPSRPGEAAIRPATLPP